MYYTCEMHFVASIVNELCKYRREKMIIDELSVRWTIWTFNSVGVFIKTNYPTHFIIYYTPTG